MRLIARLMILASAAAVLSGCSYVNSLTGQTDNTVLPGKREDAIPGRSSFPVKQDVQVGSTSKAAEPAAPNAAEPYCAPDDKSCKPPTTTGDTFKDPQ